VDFNSHTDLVVAVAVRLVNTLTPGEAHGGPYAPPPAGAELRRAVLTAIRGEDSDRPPRVPLTDDDAARLVPVAVRLRRVFATVAGGDLDGAAAEVNDLLAETDARPHLDRHDDEPWHLHFHGPVGTFAGEYSASCATGLAIVLGSEYHDRLGVCTAPRCDRVYVDTSRNGTRRFCSTSCQNRVKAAAFRARANAD
jgi:predicted RNA-binding Zn ribbon-like protein